MGTDACLCLLHDEKDAPPRYTYIMPDATTVAQIYTSTKQGGGGIAMSCRRDGGAGGVPGSSVLLITAVEIYSLVPLIFPPLLLMDS